MTVALESLIGALRRHADALSDEHTSPSEAIPVIAEVRTAALAYVEAIFEASGWGNVFEDLYEEETSAEEDLEEEDDGRVRPDGKVVLAVRARWDFAVPDVEALLAAGRTARARVWAGTRNESEPIGHPAEAIYELMHAAGLPFTALDIPELESLSGVVTVDSEIEPMDLDSDEDFFGDLDELMPGADEAEPDDDQ